MRRHVRASLLCLTFAMGGARVSLSARMSLAPRASSFAGYVRDRVRATGARSRLERDARERVVRTAAAAASSEASGLTMLAIPREGRVRRLRDLLLLARVKLDLDESQFALRVATDYAHDLSALSDLDFSSLATRLEADARVVHEELRERILSPEEALSIAERLRLDTKALREVGERGGTGVARPPEAAVQSPPPPPLTLPLSRLQVPLTLEVATPASAVRLSNASALRVWRNASRSSLVSAAVNELQTDSAKAAAFSRALWARLNGRRPCALQQSLEVEAGALTRLGREVAALRAQVGDVTARAEALGGALERQGRRALGSQPLSLSAAALDALRASIRASTVAVHLDRVYATLESELVVLIAPQGAADDAVDGGAPADGGADGGGGGASASGHGEGGGLALKPAQLLPLIDAFERCEQALGGAEAALAAPARAAPAPGSALVGAEQAAYALLGEVGLPAMLDSDWLEEISPQKSWPKISSVLAAALGRLKRGVAFYARGAHFMSQDIRLAATLVLRAARGHTLTQREARAVRRTAKDVVMLVPFTVLLLVPLSPLGHVLVFGFLQRVWPGFFPSAFTDGRQGMLDMYESLMVVSEAPPAEEPAA